MGFVFDVYGADFFSDFEPNPFIRTILRQVDALLDGRDTEWDDFGLGVVQGLCMAVGLQHKRKDGRLDFGFEPYYSWDDAKFIRERGCVTEIRDKELAELLHRLAERVSVSEDAGGGAGA